MRVFPADWPLVSAQAMPFVERVVEVTGGRYTAKDMERFVLDGTLVAWVIYDRAEMIGWAASEILLYPQKKVCSTPFLAGDRLADWIDRLHQRIEEYARSVGCTAMEGWGLRAWVKFLPGWKVNYVALSKEL